MDQPPTCPICEVELDTAAPLMTASAMQSPQPGTPASMWSSESVAGSSTGASFSASTMRGGVVQLRCRHLMCKLCARTAMQAGTITCPICWADTTVKKSSSRLSGSNKSSPSSAARPSSTAENSMQKPKSVVRDSPSVLQPKLQGNSVNRGDKLAAQQLKPKASSSTSQQPGATTTSPPNLFNLTSHEDYQRLQLRVPPPTSSSGASSTSTGGNTKAKFNNEMNEEQIELQKRVELLRQKKREEHERRMFGTDGTPTWRPSPHPSRPRHQPPMEVASPPQQVNASTSPFSPFKQQPLREQFEVEQQHADPHQSYKKTPPSSAGKGGNISQSSISPSTAPIHNDDRTICEKCCRANAVFGCHHCDLTLCQKCNGLHHQGQWKNHEVLALGDFIQQCFIPYCRVPGHEGHRCELFCLEDSVCICALCTAQDPHRFVGKNVLPIEEATTQLKMLQSAWLQQQVDKQNFFDAELHRIDDTVRVAETLLEDQLSKATRNFDAMRAKITEVEMKVKARITDDMQVQVESVLRTRQYLVEERELLVNAAIEVQGAVESGSPSKILGIKKPTHIPECVSVSLPTLEKLGVRYNIKKLDLKECVSVPPKSLYAGMFRRPNSPGRSYSAQERRGGNAKEGRRSASANTHQVEQSKAPVGQLRSSADISNSRFNVSRGNTSSIQSNSSRPPSSREAAWMGEMHAPPSATYFSRKHEDSMRGEKPRWNR